MAIGGEKDNYCCPLFIRLYFLYQIQGQIMAKSITKTPQRIIFEDEETHNAILKMGVNVDNLSHDEILSLLEKMMFKSKGKYHEIRYDLRHVYLEILRMKMNASFDKIQECHDKMTNVFKEVSKATNEVVEKSKGVFEG